MTPRPDLFGVIMIETDDLRDSMSPEQLVEMRVWLSEDKLRRTPDAGRRLTDCEWREERESELDFEARIAALADRVGELWEEDDPESGLVTAGDVEATRRRGRHFHVRGTCTVMRLDSVRAT